MDHPYKKLEGKPLWQALERAVAELVSNGDIVEQTHRNYIVGYLCSELEKVASQNKSQE